MKAYTLPFRPESRANLSTTLCLGRGTPTIIVGFFQIAKPVNSDETTVIPTAAFQTASLILLGTVV